MSIAAVKAIHQSDERKINRDAFLRSHDVDTTSVVLVAGDASFRHYYRGLRSGESVIIMDAPPPYELITPFIEVATYLNECGVNAPTIYASDVEQGFVLLEDFGDLRFTTVLKRIQEPDFEEHLYKEAIDALIHIQKQPVATSLNAYNDAVLLNEVSLFSEWYLPALFDQHTSKKRAEEFEHIWKTLLPLCHSTLNDVVVLRDYHADNLMWMEQNEGMKRIGVLDFQDALIGSPAYDVVSLLEDARREVSPVLSGEMLAYYMERSAIENKDDFLQNYAVLAAQRNMKIIGIFTRLAVRDLKPNYVEMIPRMWRYLERDLQHPVLKELHDWCEQYFDVGTKNDANFLKGNV